MQIATPKPDWDESQIDEFLDENDDSYIAYDREGNRLLVYRMDDGVAYCPLMRGKQNMAEAARIARAAFEQGL